MQRGLARLCREWGIVNLSFSRINKSAVYIDNPSDKPNGIPPHFARGRHMEFDEPAACHLPLLAKI